MMMKPPSIIWALLQFLYFFNYDPVQCLKCLILPRISVRLNHRHTIAIRKATTSSIRNDIFRRQQLRSTKQEEHDPNQQQSLLNSNNLLEQVLKDQQKKERIRKVQRIEKFARLPVWPVINGVLIWLIGNIFGSDIAGKIENTITGRVGPNFYQYRDTTPYIMLVHHCHSFAFFDPLRYIQRTFFPEGFPSHPHRGFITITYILHGGFVHRDSEGLYQMYGSSNSSSTTTVDRYKGKHTQWLFTGRGILHEEMFDLQSNPTLDWNHLNSRQELYQIWLNVPAKYKMNEPCSLLLGGDDETPVIYGADGMSKTLVLAGSYGEKASIAPSITELVLFHVTLQPNTTWQYCLPSDQFETVFLYIRQGSLQTTGMNTNDSGEDDKVSIPVHNTAYFNRRGGDVISVTSDNTEIADFMFLAGVPINEPYYASGSMVMNYPNEIDNAYNDYQKGLFGIPWDYKLSNDEWKSHIEKTKKSRW